MGKKMLKHRRQQVALVAWAMRKSRGFGIYVGGGRKAACEREVVTGSDWESDRMDRKEY